MREHPLSQLLDTCYPVIQAGMVLCSGWKLASAVSNAGGLGVLGTRSMHPESLHTQIYKIQQATNKPFGINIPLMFPGVFEIMELAVKSKASVIITSAGNPEQWTGFLHNYSKKVFHVIANLKFARKAARVRVDADIGEGFEAGGHNGRDENTTFTLIPLLKRWPGCRKAGLLPGNSNNCPVRGVQKPACLKET